MSRRHKTKMRRLKQKQQRKDAKKLKELWEATPFKLRTLLSNIGFHGDTILSVWLKFRRDKYPMEDLTNFFVRGYGTRRLRVESVLRDTAGTK